ncbi:MAG: RsmD family RNA methyltransferase [Bacteroidota bacterium]
MRIISGKFKGRRFYPPAKNWPTRPTTDFAKEGLFNILRNQFEFDEIKVLDLFCGTGNHSYEFISRGCTDVTCVDKFKGCIAFIKEIADKLEIEKELRVVRADVFKFIASVRDTYDYIFAGPPYGLANMDSIPDLIFEHSLIKSGGWFVMEHNPNHDYSGHPNFVEARHYGKTIFSIFTPTALNSENE